MGEEIYLIPNVSSLAVTTPTNCLSFVFPLIVRQSNHTNDKQCDRGNKKKKTDRRINRGEKSEMSPQMCQALRDSRTQHVSSCFYVVVP